MIYALITVLRVGTNCVTMDKVEFPSMVECLHAAAAVQEMVTPDQAETATSVTCRRADPESQKAGPEGPADGGKT